MPDPQPAAAAGTLADERPYWIGFSHVPGIGPARFGALLAHFGSAAAAWRAPGGALRAVLDQRSLETFLTLRDQLDPHHLAATLADAHITPLTVEDPEYPDPLRATDQAPFLLYVQGRLPLLRSRAVAVVGTRRCTPYGRRAAADIAGGLAAAGITVVSGLARGIDTAAHEAALDQGHTLAVLGTGPDVCYPVANTCLQRGIAAAGAVITEYPPGSTAEPGNFPARNRIVSGLCLATVVVEASHKSGALLTARMAADQGRDVLAVPGPIYAPTSQGANRLLADGAGVARSAEDVLAAIGLADLEGRPAPTAPPPDPGAEPLLAALRDGTGHIDALARAIGQPVAEVSRTLSVLEISGHVVHLGGQSWAAR